MQYIVFENYLKQGRSTWEIPNSENMDTDTYYKALNKRIADMKAVR